MTLADPPAHALPAFLSSEPPEFPQVLALPQRTQVPEGDLYSFRFANGYGALVIRPALGESAFELCVLDCAGPAPQPTFLTPVCDRVQTGLSHEGVAQLLARAERLPRHPDLARADERLLGEVF